MSQSEADKRHEKYVQRKQRKRGRPRKRGPRKIYIADENTGYQNSKTLHRKRRKQQRHKRRTEKRLQRFKEIWNK